MPSEMLIRVSRRKPKPLLGRLRPGAENPSMRNKAKFGALVRQTKPMCAFLAWKWGPATKANPILWSKANRPLACGGVFPTFHHSSIPFRGQACPEPSRGNVRGTRRRDAFDTASAPNKANFGCAEPEMRVERRNKANLQGKPGGAAGLRVAFAQRFVIPPRGQDARGTRRRDAFDTGACGQRTMNWLAGARVGSYNRADNGRELEGKVCSRGCIA